METAAAAVVSLIVSALTTLLVHRHRERVSRDEAAQADLLKLRNEAMVMVLRSVSQQYWFGIQVMEPDDPNDEQGKRVAETRLARAARSTVRVFESRMFLLPHEFRTVIARALSDMADATTGDQMRDIGIYLGNEMERYLPRLPRRRLSRAETMSLEEDRQARAELKAAGEAAAAAGSPPPAGAPAE